MKFRFIILFFLFASCAQNHSIYKSKKPLVSKGFAYIYNQEDFNNKLIKRKLNNDLLEVAHNKLRPGSFIRIINIKTNDAIILKTSKRFDYPDFYKILITKAVADKLNLKSDFPIVEVIEVKKNKSFVAKKTKIFKEEEQIHDKAPVETVTVSNIAKNTFNKKNKLENNDFYIIIAEFYSNTSALNLKERITQELINFDSKKLLVSSKKSKKSTLLSGPYSSINLMKNDYIQLKKFGFEDLDIILNDNK